MVSAPNRIALVMSLSLSFTVAVTACAEPAPPVDPADDDDEEVAPVPPGPYDSLDVRPCPENTALTWENFGEPFMRNWCTGCHSTGLDEAHRALAPIDINFDTRDDVVTHMERIWGRAGDQNNTMPPASDPAPGDRDLLGEWLACGALTREELHGP